MILLTGRMILQDNNDQFIQYQFPFIPVSMAQEISQKPHYNFIIIFGAHVIPTLIPLWDSKNVGKKSYISSRHLATRFSFCRVMKPGCATSWVESPTQIGGWAVIFHRKSDVYWEYVPKVVGFQGVLPLLSWPFQQQSSFTQQMCELMIHVSHVFQLCSQSHQDQIARRLSPHAVSFQSSSCRLPGELRKTHQ